MKNKDLFAGESFSEITNNTDNTDNIDNIAIASHLDKIGHSVWGESTVKFRNEKPCVVVVGGDNGIGAMHAIEMTKKIGADIGTIIAEPLTKNTNLSDAILDIMDSRNYLGSTPNKQILEASKLDYERISRMVPKGTKVFNYPDGFSCNARNQKNADRKHKNYLKDKN